MRGKVETLYTELSRIGITPAYAGKSIVKSFNPNYRRDHPRLCGEKGEKVGDAIGGAGSPPPMRGKAETFAVADLLVGITPAYAGKRVWSTIFRKLE